MIELGLARVGRLLQHTPLPWKAIHVAGTNGKGSVCAYVSALLHGHGVRCGRFTSPHLIDRWDCITINEKVVSEAIFRKVEQRVKDRDRDEEIRASEFEVLTATAFEIFTEENVDIAAIEVGLGGRLDATNILKNPLVTVITKIGMDHESFLGSTLKEIAYQKAGILKKEVPCVVDATNDSTVLDVIHECAKEVQAGPVLYVPSDSGSEAVSSKPHQVLNQKLALAAVREAMKARGSKFDEVLSRSIMDQVLWPGRLQHLSIEVLTGRNDLVLLDGAHNVQSAEVLGAYINTTLRKAGEPITWVLSASQGKDLKQMLPPLIQESDYVVATGFGPVDGMPWVKAQTQDDIVNAIEAMGVGVVYEDNLFDALTEATAMAGRSPMVIAGSLYLVSDVLRLLRRRMRQTLKS
ncbi:folylpolyglutamate synthase [Agyrium rufum]|nr:folylpolyglutamate synthase [Agyrium rufum]